MMIKMLTAALTVMLKILNNTIAKTLITSITALFIIPIRLYSIFINEEWMFLKFFFPNKELLSSSVSKPLYDHRHIFA